jgi:hypothetical protein
VVSHSAGLWETHGVYRVLRQLIIIVVQTVDWTSVMVFKQLIPCFTQLTGWSLTRASSKSPNPQFWQFGSNFWHERIDDSSAAAIEPVTLLVRFLSSRHVHRGVLTLKMVSLTVPLELEHFSFIVKLSSTTIFLSQRLLRLIVRHSLIVSRIQAFVSSSFREKLTVISHLEVRRLESERIVFTAVSDPKIWFITARLSKSFPLRVTFSVSLRHLLSAKVFLGMGHVSVQCLDRSLVR